MTDRYPSLFAQSVAEAPLESGIHHGQFRLDNRQEWTYTLSRPDTVLEKYPLVIALHWAGPPTPYLGEELLRCLVEPGLRSLHPLIFAPDAGDQLWWNSTLSTRLKQFIDHALTYWPVDPDRIIVTGYSNGGNGTWHLARLYPHLISAAIPIAAAVQTEVRVETPIFAIHGEKDDLFPFAAAKANVEAIARKSPQVIFLPAPDRIHFAACTYVPELQQAAEWIRNKPK